MYTLQQSKQYLLQRLNAEQSSSRNLQSELTHFAQRLQSLLTYYYITDPLSPQATNNQPFQQALQKLLQDLQDTLIENTELLSEAANPQDKDHLLLYIHQPRNNTTLTQRLNHWSTLYLTHLLTQLSPQNPHTSTPTPPLTTGAPYGIDRLLRTTIAYAWMHNLINQNQDAQGFYIRRGSTYPCALCDEPANIWHPITDINLPDLQLPRHPNCCCFYEFTATQPH